MKYLQKLGKALMLPVACLPICGILMGIGYLLCPATMQGGDVTGVLQQIGFFLVKAGGALIDNMALLFVIGVGVGMSEDNDGTGGLAALASWLMITSLLSTGVVTTIMPSIAEDEDAMLAFGKIANPFIGILSGVIGATCYNKFKGTKLPDWLSFFSGKRCVAIIAGVVSIVVSAILLFVWPVVFGLLISLGNGIAGMGAFGAAIYAFLNRLLIPTGLHHALNNVFWFDTIGLGDLTHFWAGETSADVSWSLGMYMSGFFPCMMFGIPGAALAMIQTAKSNKRKVAIGLVASAAVCSFVCGVTEPFEFGFMFLAPGLYLIYAILYGIFTFITVLLGFRAGFSFSAGATDLLFSASLPAAANTWLIIPLGIAAFLVFYLVFRFAIVKFDLKTPGREDDDLEAEKSATLANNDYTQVAAVVLEGVGGKANVTSLDNCITRLRFEIKDYTKVDEKKIKSAGVAGVIRPSKNAVQVIVGTKVQFVADEMKKMLK
ncbi:MAG TPA: PTS transporter subunit EIIC [Candidatus Eisenbergiella merdigallinarum]|uniref:PTS transporter subunit EIIC n=1 Tax=Candidatus Eisenbergiella merdigallinarum TaxID=2838552 RepID=A0A9D2MSM1_9FIRM|nr:PTS transporter subunit EIIC [Candidatus Eisenbergiella merdigallinarum]